MIEFTALLRAPSNIAVIKYMGKADASRNIPANSSLSMTLKDLATWVRLEARTANAASVILHEMNAGEVPGVDFFPGSFSEKASARVSAFFDRAVPLLKTVLEGSGIGFRPAALSCWTANTFPSGAGVASSASSFAALTLAWALGFAADAEKFRREFERGSDTAGDLRLQLSSISRLGSGSSCRSFFGPWVRWTGESASPVPSRLEPLMDLVLLIESTPKSVSSSEAHQRVQTSALYGGRAHRAEQRLSQLQKSLSDGKFALVREIGWSEAMEMHALFHTARPPFSYWLPQTTEMLRVLMSDFKGSFPELQPPLVTLDAGANIHLLIPATEGAKWKATLAAKFPRLRLLEDSQGGGPEILRIGGGAV